MRVLFRVKNTLQSFLIRCQVSWLKPLLIYKRELVVVILFSVFIGVVLGYYYRTAQVEPVRDQEMVLLYRELQDVKRFNSLLAKDLTKLETSVGILQGKHLRVKK